MLIIEFQINLDFLKIFSYTIIADKLKLIFNSFLSYRDVCNYVSVKAASPTLKVEPIKAVSPTVSGTDKSGESYRKWNRLRLRLSVAL